MGLERQGMSLVCAWKTWNMIDGRCNLEIMTDAAKYGTLTLCALYVLRLSQNPLAMHGNIKPQMPDAGEEAQT
jgi:hypothetical protein